MGKLAIGLLIGFVAGLGASALRDDSSSGPGRRPSAGERERGAQTEGTTASAGESGLPASPPVADPRAVLRQGSWKEIRDLAHAEGEPIDPGAWPALIQPRLDAAREAGDWRLFHALLEAAARAGTPDAHALLLAVMQDESLRFPQRMGSFFQAALADADVPGISAAARRRIELGIVDGDTAWTGIAGWAELVATHGTRDEIAWLLGDELSRVSPQFSSRAREAAVSSDNPAAVELALPRLSKGMEERGSNHEAWGNRVFGKFAEHHPDEALALVEQWRSENPEGTLGDHHVRSLAAGVDDRLAPRLHAILATPRDVGERIAFCYAVQALDRAGREHDSLRFLLQAPVELLENVAAGGATAHERDLAGKARYAIEYNPLLWTERAAAALEAAGFADEAKLVRTGLSSEWKTR